MLRIKELKKKFGSKILFEGADCIVHKGEKVALIGQNGTGKSTYIKCITGQEDFDGIIDIDSNVKISVMEQEKEFENRKQTFTEYLEEKEDFVEKLRLVYT